LLGAKQKQPRGMRSARNAAAATDDARWYAIRFRYPQLFRHENAAPCPDVVPALFYARECCRNMFVRVPTRVERRVF